MRLSHSALSATLMLVLLAACASNPPPAPKAANAAPVAAPAPQALEAVPPKKDTDLLADDEQVWAALKAGGKVILLRHTHVVIGEGIGVLAPGNCAAETNLSPRGIEQAKRLGEAFRAHGIAVGEVLASPYCRCMDTGRLVFGHATAVQYLKPPGVVSESQAALNNERVLQEILNHRGPTNLVMITHDLNIANIVLEPGSIGMGEFFVLQPKGADFDVIGNIQRYAQ